jgi:hypothetical protein
MVEDSLGLLRDNLDKMGTRIGALEVQAARLETTIDSHDTEITTLRKQNTVWSSVNSVFGALAIGIAAFLRKS